jgi:hypothetical protein
MTPLLAGKAKTGWYQVPIGDILTSMKQQALLREAMTQSGQTRIQLAAAIGVAKRTLD